MSKDLKQLLKKKVDNAYSPNDSYNFDDKDTSKLMQESHYHHTIKDIILLMKKYGYRHVLDTIEVEYYNMYYGKFDSGETTNNENIK
jgi:hypothetical protein